MPYSFGGVSTLATDGTIQWTSGVAAEHDADPADVLGRKVWDWSPDARSVRMAIADAIFDGSPQTYVAGWMPPGGTQVLKTKVTAFPLPRGRMHDIVLLWADTHYGRALTRIEARTLRCFADGFTQQETARHIGVSIATVKATLARARHKLDARNVTQAVALAIKRGLI